MIKLADFYKQTTTDNTFYSLKRDGIKYCLVVQEFEYLVTVVAGKEKMKPKSFEKVNDAIDYITLLCKLNNIDTYATAVAQYQRGNRY